MMVGAEVCAKADIVSDRAATRVAARGQNEFMDVLRKQPQLEPIAVPRFVEKRNKSDAANAVNSLIPWAICHPRESH